jgi:hypothetical protein
MKLLPRKLFEAGVKDLFNDVYHGDIDLQGQGLKMLPTDLPDEIHGQFKCCDNYLKSLEGSPRIIRGDFDCSENALKSLEGCPKEVFGDFYCHNQFSGKHFAEEDVIEVCNVHGTIYNEDDQ